MATLETEAVGRLWLPELDRIRFLPGASTGRRARHLSVVTFDVRHEGRKTQAGHGLGVVNVEGLARHWDESDDLQQQFETPERMVEIMLQRIRALKEGRAHWVYHNERVNNGGKMMSKGFFGTSSSPTSATINAPNRLAVSNASGLAVAAGDQSLGSATANVTTNEATTAGLARTAALTPGAVTDPSTLNGQLSFTLSNTFTATGTISAYGAAAMDNTTTTFNQFAEATHAVASLVSGDTYTPTMTVSN